MKRLMIILLAIVMSALMCVSVCAATGAFDGSPSGKPAPELIYGANESEDCESILSITAYGDRDKLSENSRLKIEEAYSQIIGTQNLSSLNEYIAQVAREKGIDPADLAVSDLFDISATNCSGHNDHGHFDITLKAEVLENFVCLLHYFEEKNDTTAELEFEGAYTDENLAKDDRTEPWKLTVDGVEAGNSEIILGVGKFYVGTTKEDAEYVGLTRGGGSFVVEREFREINADGDPGLVADRVEKEMARPKLKLTALQWLTKVSTLYSCVQVVTA